MNQNRDIPVLVPAASFRRVYDPSVGRSEPWYINDHTFVRDRDGRWHLFGITRQEPMAPFEEVNFAHAVAERPEGPWTTQPFALTAAAEHDETHLWAPHVVDHDGVFWMYYCAGGPTKSTYRIHLATSTDCRRWERHPANPMIVDGFEARDPMVARIDDRWVMYYTATSEPEGGHFVVAAAESVDLVHWSGRTIVYEDPMTGTMAGPTESPFVFAHDGHYYLLIGPDWAEVLALYLRNEPILGDAYRRTKVLRSTDPLHFEPGDQVATIEAHAAEVVVDDDGTYWVSHCGWGQGGVHLAPLPLDVLRGLGSRGAP